MVKLEEIAVGTVLRGIRPNENVTVETVEWDDADVIKVAAGSSVPTRTPTSLASTGS